MMLRTPLALAGATALAVTTGLVTTANPSQAAATKSYAYGVSINGEGKQPYVESTDGSTQTTGGAPIPQNPLVYGNIAELKAGDDFASVRVANLTVGEATQQLPAELTAELEQLQQICAGLQESPSEQLFDGIRENVPTELELPTEDDVVQFCNELLDADLPALAAIDTVDIECNGDSGAVTIAGVSILGAQVPLAGRFTEETDLLAGQASPLAQAVQVTFNRQTARPDGSFTVDGVVVSLGGGQGEIVLGSTTCGEPLPEVKGRARTAPRPAQAPAPAPTPVQQSVPVTG